MQACGASEKNKCRSVRGGFGKDHPVTRLDAHSGSEAIQIDFGDGLGWLD
jgi:hypothetical protein